MWYRKLQYIGITQCAYIDDVTVLAGSENDLMWKYGMNL